MTRPSGKGERDEHSLSRTKRAWVKPVLQTAEEGLGNVEFNAPGPSTDSFLASHDYGVS